MIKEKKSMILNLVLNTLPLAVITVVLLWANARSGGWESVSKGLEYGWKMLVRFMPILIFIFLAMGQAQVLIKNHEEAVRSGMSGERGLIASFVAGFLSPGNISGLPIVRVMWDDGFPKRALLIFLVTSTLVNLQTAMMRAPFIGWKIAGIQYGVCICIAVVFLLVVWVCEKIFG